MSSARGAYKLQPASGHQPPAANTIRGADALVRALAGGGAGTRVQPAGIALDGQALDRKTVKRVNKITRQAVEALDARLYPEAEALFDEAIAILDPVPPRLWCFRLIAAAKAANYGYVVDNYERIRALAPSKEEQSSVDRAWVDCLIAAGLFHEALHEAEMLVAVNPGSWAAINSTIGVIHSKLGNFDEAIAIQKAILEEDPSFMAARWNLAIHQMEAGHLPEALDNYEARWDWPDFPSERRVFDVPRWNGEDLQGKRVLVWREQGIGDEIRFASLLPDLVATGARITFECSGKLLGLFRKSFPAIDIRAELPPSMRKRADYRDFDFHVPIGSLARHFRPTVADIQAKCAAWLNRDSEIENRVRADMQAEPRQPVIGICWRSSKLNMQRNRHYMTGDHLAPLKLLGKSKFLCLQYDECKEEIASMRQLGLPLFEFPNIDQMNDLVSASYLIGACDIVISAGTATAELSAGLGVPTVMFGLKWGQTQLGTDGVPWHPATRVLPSVSDDPLGVAKHILFNWKDIAAWAEKSSISGRVIDWRLSHPGAA